jgi:hypothetical protein
MVTRSVSNNSMNCSLRTRTYIVSHHHTLLCHIIIYSVTSSYIVSHHHTYNCPFRTRTCRSQVLPPADTDRHSQTQTQARAQTHRKRAQKQRHRQTRSHYFSSIDMYNNDVGKRFMK